MVSFPILDYMALCDVLAKDGYLLHPWRPKHRPMMGKMSKDGAEALIYRASVTVAGRDPQPLLQLLAEHPELMPPQPPPTSVIRPRAKVRLYPPPRAVAVATLYHIADPTELECTLIRAGFRINVSRVPFLNRARTWQHPDGRHLMVESGPDGSAMVMASAEIAASLLDLEVKP